MGPSPDEHLWKELKHLETKPLNPTGLLTRSGSKYLSTGGQVVRKVIETAAIDKSLCNKILD